MLIESIEDLRGGQKWGPVKVTLNVEGVSRQFILTYRESGIKGVATVVGDDEFDNLFRNRPEVCAGIIQVVRSMQNPNQIFSVLRKTFPNLHVSKGPVEGDIISFEVWDDLDVFVGLLSWNGSNWAASQGNYSPEDSSEYKFDTPKLALESLTSE